MSLSLSENLEGSLTFTTMPTSPLISEFQPNPDGGDPAIVSFEISGIAGQSFNGVIVSIENDGINGTVDRLSNVSGTFDSNGLLVVDIADLENPSFTVVLASQFTGNLGDD